MSFASRLRQAREQAGFTQQDLAKKLGVTKNAISNYENGVSSPKWEILVEIFDILHVDPNFLYQDDFSSELAEAHVLTPQQSTLLAAFDQLNEISIHALREEGDPVISVTVGATEKFLSTPSARRATGR